MKSYCREHVTVGIVGGGIAGLSLAKMLEMAGISYFVWEAHGKFAPSVGASLGLTPNGLRILDQLGVVEQISQVAVPHQKWEHRDGNGNLRAILTAIGCYPKLLGYESFFTERQRVLQALYDSIEDKSRLQANKQVVAVKQTHEGATILARDGTEAACEIIAGADGVRSVIRHEILKRETMPENATLQFDARYTCVYGISSPVSTIEPGGFFTIYRPDVCLLVFSGYGGSLYWFIVNDLKEQTIKYKAPRTFSDEDINTLYIAVADTTVTDGVKFADIYQRRRTAVMTALEEGVADSLFSGKLFVLGDSAHKMTPNGAMGANQALESAAAFVNVLRPLLQRNLRNSPMQGITQLEIDACLKEYSDRRRERVLAVLNKSSIGCQAQLKIGPVSEKLWHDLPTMTNADLLNSTLKSFSEAEVLENWGIGSEKVEVYTATAEKVKKGLTLARDATL